MNATEQRSPPHELLQQDINLLASFAERFNGLLDANGYAQDKSSHRHERLAAEFGQSVSGTRKWCKGLAIPSPATLIAIAKRFGTTTDFLLGLSTSSGMVQVPVFRLDSTSGSDIEPAAGNFAHVTNLYWDKHSLASDTEGLCSIEYWSELVSPQLHRGDLLLLDLNVRHLVDNSLYFLRTSSTYCVRRMRAHLNGNIEMSAEYGDHRDSTVVAKGDISFNATRSVNDAPPAAGLKVIGRVLRIDMKLVPKIPGFK